MVYYLMNLLKISAGLLSSTFNSFNTALGMHRNILQSSEVSLLAYGILHIAMDIHQLRFSG